MQYLVPMMLAGLMALAVPVSGAEDIPEWKRDYIRSVEARLQKADGRMHKVTRDTAKRFRPDSIIYRGALSEARARKLGVSRMVDSLAGWTGEAPPPDWALRWERIDIYLDGLDRLWSTTHETLDRRARARYGLDPRLESIRGGADREWWIERRDVERARQIQPQKPAPAGR